MQSVYFYRSIKISTQRMALTVAAVFAFLIPFDPALAWTAAENSRARGGEIVMQDLPAKAGATVEALTYVAAPPKAVLDVLWDHEKFPEFMPSARTSRVLERQGGEVILEQVGGQGFITVNLVTRRHRSATRIEWSLVRGDLAVNDGYWEALPATGGTWLHYHVHVVPKVPVPGRVTAFLQKQALPAMCRAVRGRVESVAKHAR